MTDSRPGLTITRRTALAGALGTAALAAARPTLAQARQGKPNVLYIMADDLGYADLSCYGRRDYTTPVLDRLATEGMMFMHAYANSAVCTATRVGLITGRYQYRLPVGLQEPLGPADVGLPSSAEQPTMPSLMRDAGYATTLVGKWHMGSLPKYGPLKSGYDEFWGLYGGGVDYFTHGFGGNPDLWDGETRIEAAGYTTDLLADATIRTLERRKQDGKPFFISLHFTAPHWPWEGNDEEGRAESARIARGGPGIGGIQHYDGGTLATYAKMMKSLDDNIGRVLARLAELGFDRDTIVVFTSDNGGERFSDTWPFTGKKTELLEGGLRIPAIVRWPGVVQAGSRSNERIISMDWLPTFVAAGGGQQSAAFPSDGTDIWPALAGGTLPARTLFWRYTNKQQRAALRGNYKYLKINENEFLFDVVADPLERGNLKLREPERFAELKAAWEQWDQGMLHDPAAASAGSTPDHLADHFNTPPPPARADD
ncbi:MAG TPA: sulfatase-like hydrolase/transferase [Croceibacterium sp.]|nr:sulfatase-like hydrolase/transferase [Croceibacterium sp.]